MDIYCPVCGEPWDRDELHYVSSTPYDLAVKLFRREGCRVFGGKHNKNADLEKAEHARVVYDLLGDDMDGAASELEDLP